MSAFTKIAKSFNIFHAIGFSVAAHLLLLTFFPALSAKATIKLENKVEKVRLEIIKRSKPPQVHKKKPVPVMRKAVLRNTAQVLPKRVHTKPLRTKSTQSIHLKPARKISVSNKTSFSANRLSAVHAPINRSRNNSEVSSMPYAKRAVSGVDHSNLSHNFKVVRKVSSFASSNNMRTGKAVRVSTRSFTSSSFAPTARVVKSSIKVAEEENNSITGNDFKEVWGRYTDSIQLKIAKAKTYPSIARERKQQGKAFLYFKLDKDGKILELSVENSSGYKILDQAAIKAIKEAAPFPTIPASLNKNYASLKIPISFVLR